MLFLSVIIALLDGLGLTMFLPLLQMADGNSTAAGEGLGNLDFIIRAISALGIKLNIRTALMMLFVFFLLKGVIVYTASTFKVKISQYFASTLRINLTNLFTRYSFKAFISSDIGRIQNSFTGEIARITGAYTNYSDCIQQLVMVIVYLGFVFMVDLKFAILVCIGGVLSNFFLETCSKRLKNNQFNLLKIIAISTA